MTLSSRHRIPNSSPGGLRPSTLPLGHGGSRQYWLLHVDGEETFLFFFKPPRPGTEPRTPAWKAAVLTTTIGPPPDITGTRNLWGVSSTTAPLLMRDDLSVVGCSWGSSTNQPIRRGNTTGRHAQLCSGDVRAPLVTVKRTLTQGWIQCWFNVGPASTTLAQH